jgi:hypothetical protein
MDFPELIQLFATHKVAVIHTVPEYIDLCGRYAGNRQFQRQRDDAELAKTDLEGQLDEQPTYKSQILAALDNLQAQRIVQFDLYYALVTAGYKPKWSAAQQAYFEREVPRIRSGNDFFLSFTSRSPTVGDKRINHRYWYFISEVIGADHITTDERRTKNLLAEALYAKLVDFNLKGFYYVRHENDNAILKNKLHEGCRGSRAFVQLVESVMFDPPSGRPNYCEFEYREAVKFIHDEDRILFVVAEERSDRLERPETVHKPYRDWLEHVLRKAAPYLPEADRDDRRRVEEIRSKLSEVIEMVRAARRSALGRIPD